MPEIARVFAEQAQTEAFAQAILASISFLPGEPSSIFLVKFVLLSVPALFIIIGAPITGWISDNWGRKSLLNASLLIFGVAGVSFMAMTEEFDIKDINAAFAHLEAGKARYRVVLKM